MDTLIVNLYGGPGTGKSRMAAGIFSKLKFKNINCELVPEFAKDLVWEKRHDALYNQFYVTAKQYHRIHRLLGNVDVIITDSPVLLGLAYSGDFYLGELIKSLYAKMKTYDVFLKRVNPYNPAGRYQSEGGATELDPVIKNILQRDFSEYSEKKPFKEYDEFDASEESIIPIVNRIVELVESIED